MNTSRGILPATEKTARAVEKYLIPILIKRLNRGDITAEEMRRQINEFNQRKSDRPINGKSLL